VLAKISIAIHMLSASDTTNAMHHYKNYFLVYGTINFNGNSQKSSISVIVGAKMNE
jgi:hypothetical protein